MDIVNSAAFAFNDSLSGTKHQFDYLTSIPNFSPTIASDGSLEFPHVPQLADIAAFVGFIECGGKAATSPMPRLTYYWMRLTSPSFRRFTAEKNRIVIREIQKSVNRIQEPNDDGLSLSAIDNILRRETTVAAKEGRKPNFFSPRIRDEVMLLTRMKPLLFLTGKTDIWLCISWP
jgi:hypothetical protein